MTFRFDLRRHMPISGLAALIFALAGCQSGGPSGLFSRDAAPAAESVAAQDDRISRTELLAYCPKVSLREGTAYFNTYARAPAGEPKDDRSLIVYQASVSDVTRSCRYGEGQLSMTVAVAGRVIPGPKGKAGTVNLPLRIVVARGSEVLYSKLHKYPVAIPSATGATQYVFRDDSVVVPMPDAANLQVFAGFDEGPYDTP